MTPRPRPVDPPASLYRDHTALGLYPAAVRHLVGVAASRLAISSLRVAQWAARRPPMRSDDLPCLCTHRQDAHTRPRDGLARTCTACRCPGFQLDRDHEARQNAETRARAAHPSRGDRRREDRRGNLRPPRLAVVPDGYAQGRADLQLTHQSRRATGHGASEGDPTL